MSADDVEAFGEEEDDRDQSLSNDSQIRGPMDALGRLVLQPIRSVWPHEAADFTPWVAKNLDLLGEATGLVLEFVATEHQIGRFFLDLLLSDDQGRTVVVENQYGQTDHDHLGKVLTYTAGTGAEVAVWIAERFTDEHVAALERLNEATTEEYGYFGIELQLFRIDDSRPAPYLKTVVRPNQWAKKVRAETPAPREWSFEAYRADLGTSPERVAVARELVARTEQQARDRGHEWKIVFRKGYVAFQKAGGRNSVIVDVLWRKPLRFAVKLPDSPEALGLADPYPTLESDWHQGEREWGWTIPTLANVPDLSPLFDIIEPFQT